MLEIKKMKIDDKEYVMKCSLLTVESFEKISGKKFGSVISSFVNLGNITDDESISEDERNNMMFDYLFSIQSDVSRLAYCMIMEAKRDGYNSDFNCSLEDWLSSIGRIDIDTLKGVLAVAMSVFPRKV